MVVHVLWQNEMRTLQMESFQWKRFKRCRRRPGVGKIQAYAWFRTPMTGSSVHLCNEKAIKRKQITVGMREKIGGKGNNR